MAWEGASPTGVDDRSIGPDALEPSQHRLSRPPTASSTMPNPTDSALTPLPNWPILLTTELAARYLSIDENTFAMLAETSNLEPVDLGVSLIRWRRSELDRLVAKLPAVVWAPETKASNAKELDQA